MMKRLISVLVSAALVLSSAIPVFAADSQDGSPSNPFNSVPVTKIDKSTGEVVSATTKTVSSDFGDLSVTITDVEIEQSNGAYVLKNSLRAPTSNSIKAEIEVGGIDGAEYGVTLNNSVFNLNSAGTGVYSFDAGKKYQLVVEAVITDTDTGDLNKTSLYWDFAVPNPEKDGPLLTVTGPNVTVDNGIFTSGGSNYLKKELGLNFKDDSGIQRIIVMPYTDGSFDTIKPTGTVAAYASASSGLAGETEDVSGVQVTYSSLPSTSGLGATIDDTTGELISYDTALTCEVNSYYHITAEDVFGNSSDFRLIVEGISDVNDTIPPKVKIGDVETQTKDGKVTSASTVITVSDIPSGLKSVLIKHGDTELFNDVDMEGLASKDYTVTIQDSDATKKISVEAYDMTGLSESVVIDFSEHFEDNGSSKPDDGGSSKPDDGGSSKPDDGQPPISDEEMIKKLKENISLQPALGATVTKVADITYAVTDGKMCEYKLKRPDGTFYVISASETKLEDIAFLAGQGDYTLIGKVGDKEYTLGKYVYKIEVVPTENKPPKIELSTTKKTDDGIIATYKMSDEDDGLEEVVVMNGTTVIESKKNMGGKSSLIYEISVSRDASNKVITITAKDTKGKETTEKFDMTKYFDQQTTLTTSSAIKRAVTGPKFHYDDDTTTVSFSLPSSKVGNAKVKWYLLEGGDTDDDDAFEEGTGLKFDYEFNKDDEKAGPYTMKIWVGDKKAYINFDLEYRDDSDVSNNLTVDKSYDEDEDELTIKLTLDKSTLDEARKAKWTLPDGSTDTGYKIEYKVTKNGKYLFKVKYDGEIYKYTVNVDEFDEDDDDNKGNSNSSSSKPDDNNQSSTSSGSTNSDSSSGNQTTDSDGLKKYTGTDAPVPGTGLVSGITANSQTVKITMSNWDTQKWSILNKSIDPQVTYTVDGNTIIFTVPNKNFQMSFKMVNGNNEYQDYTFPVVAMNTDGSTKSDNVQTGAGASPAGTNSSNTVPIALTHEVDAIFRKTGDDELDDSDID